jgi:hypothetical protein
MKNAETFVTCPVSQDVTIYVPENPTCKVGNHATLVHDGKTYDLLITSVTPPDEHGFVTVTASIAREMDRPNP